MAIKTAGNLRTVKIPITGAGTVIADETIIMAGASQGTNIGLGIPYASGTPAEIFGKLLGASVVANDSTQTGTVWTFADIELLDDVKLCEMEYSFATADLLAVTSSSGTTVTITSLENSADCGWMYAVSGTGAGLLAFCSAINGGTATTLKATGWDSTTKIIRIHRIGHSLIALNAKSQIASTAAAGAFTAVVYEDYIDFQGNGISKVQLDPTKHDSLQLVPSTLTALHPKFTSRVVIKNIAGR